MSYSPSSSILILTICSLNKNRFGDLLNDEKCSITNQIDKNLSHQLFNKREKVRRELLSNSDLLWANTAIKDFVYNEDLLSGKDFNGNDEALYLPAIKRYCGRFYSTLGENRDILVNNSSHHLLIFSGLYGLLRPFEYIQLYSCPLVPKIQTIWKEDDLLTKILCEYIITNNIEVILDFTSLDNYRSLINWNDPFMESVTRYCATDLIAPNDQALVHFGEYLRDGILSMPERSLKELKVNKVYSGTIKFFSKAPLHSGLPKQHTIAEMKGTKSPKTPGQFIEHLDHPVIIDDINNITDDTIDFGKWQIILDTKFQQEYHQRIEKDAKIGSVVLSALIQISKHPLQTKDKTIKKLSNGKYEYRWNKYRLVYEVNKKDHTLCIVEFGTHNLSSLALQTR